MNAHKVSNWFAFVAAGLLSFMSCHNAANQKSTNPCEEAFSMALSGFVNKDLCSNDITSYNLEDQLLQVTIESSEVSGKLRFEIKLEKFDGAGLYSFSEKESFCQMTVYGASDEFYKCVTGIIDVREATRQNLQASFDITLEGFYNKKTINARGGIHL